MAIATTTALILGATALGAAGIAASQASEARKSQERVQQQKVVAQEKATEWASANAAAPFQDQGPRLGGHPSWLDLLRLSAARLRASP